MNNLMKEELEEIYKNFFHDMNIDCITGIVNDSNKRFATKPAIGDNYLNSKKKILIVSLDVGRDELFVEQGINSYQNYHQRKNSVCDYQIKGKNQHMAGVYGISLYFLKEIHGWQKEWELLENSDNFFKEILNQNYSLLPTEVLPNIALINFYNFVEVGRVKRADDRDRKFINKNLELQLNIDVINALQPDEIIVHGSKILPVFKKNIFPRITHKCNVYLTIHPSAYGKNIHYQIPRNYIDRMNSNKLTNNV